MEQTKIKKRNGRQVNVDFGKIQIRISKAGRGLKVNPLEIAAKTVQGIYEGVTTVELDNLAAETAASYAVDHPDYSTLATNIAVSALHKDTPDTFEEVYRTLKKRKLLNEGYIKTVKEIGTDKIEKLINYKKDFNFDYFGFKTLQKSYLLKVEKNGKMVPLERPQHLYMRVALTVAYDIGNLKNVFDALSNHDYTHATPTLFNSGLRNQQLASCFLINNKGDSREHIMDTLKDVAAISSAAGGIGISISNVRAAGSFIHSTGGRSNGLMPMLRTYNETARWWDQCLVEDSLIMTDNGWRRIDEVKIGDKVRTIDGTFNSIEEVKKFENKEVLSIQTSNSSLNITPEHPVLVVKDSSHIEDTELRKALKSGIIQPEWIEAKKITPLDTILSYKETKTCPGCNYDLPLDSYWKDNSRKSGLYSRCKKCSSRKITKYCYSNHEKVRKRNKETFHKRRSTDPYRKLVSNLRTDFRIPVNENYKQGRFIKYLGCSVDFFKNHIESKFTHGMTWDNYGLKGWHLDHIIPISAFDLTKEEHIYKCLHYTNFQPLWAVDNLKKGTTYENA